jgi:PKD repeat protein
MVLFGGVSVSSTKTASVIGTGSVAGADTWVWNGASWRHVAGPSLPPLPSPSACSDVTGLGGTLCARPPSLPLPAVSAPSSAAPKPSNPVGA